MQSVAPQNRHVPSVTKAFLSVHWDREKPLLLGYSGGPDSKALLYSLLDAGAFPHIAHVDHGWREESRDEALAIEREAKALGLPFFSVRLAPKERSEDEARQGRFAFFAKLAPSYAAVLLAHQADDLAETVLKRILEGAHLTNLGGMQEVSSQHGMTLWRPFLSVVREEILEYLEAKSLVPFQDSSNSDPAYLRARMRSSIFPFLNEQFGKETRKNLCLLSYRAHELKAYLDKQVELVDCDLNGLDPIEQRHLLQKKAFLNRDQLETVLDWVKKGEKSKVLCLKTKKILVDAGSVRIFSEGSTSS
ncbi:MAG: tRNA lysidine(34) synthetase TilS [Parachlamydiales bacterium]|nr:tRNA lysidine(34) synthetase TilS [Parachlamydiales bacterium]